MATPKLTRAAFAHLAEALARARAQHLEAIGPVYSEDAHDSTARALADALAATNPQFDRARFLAACGTPVEA
jgi:hypothetical protein